MSSKEKEILSRYSYALTNAITSPNLFARWFHEGELISSESRAAATQDDYTRSVEDKVADLVNALCREMKPSQFPQLLNVLREDHGTKPLAEKMDRELRQGLQLPKLGDVLSKGTLFQGPMMSLKCIIFVIAVVVVTVAVILGRRHLNIGNNSLVQFSWKWEVEDQEGDSALGDGGPGGMENTLELSSTNPMEFLKSVHNKPVFLPGIVESGETVLEIVGDREQNVSWEGYGFNVTVPEGAVPKGVTVYLRVKAILSGQFKLPDDTHLVSAIYWVSSSHVFAKEVSVHLDHFASIDSQKEASNYKLIIGKYFNTTLPYTFEIRDGVFNPHSQIGTISLMEFSFLGSIFAGREEPNYNYTLHYMLTEIEPSIEWMVNFVVAVRLPRNLQGLEKISPYPWVDQHHQILEFEEKEENKEQSVKVQIATGTDGEGENWIVLNQTSNEIFRKHVDNYLMGVKKTLPCYKARIVWKGDQERSAIFHRRVDFLGAKPPNTFHIYVSHSASKPSGCTSSEGPPQADSDLISPFREFCHSIALIGYYKDHDPLLAGLIAIAVISTAAVFMFITGMIAWRCTFKF